MEDLIERENDKKTKKTLVKISKLFVVWIRDRLLISQ